MFNRGVSHAYARMRLLSKSLVQTAYAKWLSGTVVLITSCFCVSVHTLHMTQAYPDPPMDEDDLRPADREILDELHDGRATKGALVDWTGYSRNTVYNRLNVLEAAGHVEVAHDGTRLFEIASDPRE